MEQFKCKKDYYIYLDHRKVNRNSKKIRSKKKRKGYYKSNSVLLFKKGKSYNIAIKPIEYDILTYVYTELLGSDFDMNYQTYLLSEALDKGILYTESELREKKINELLK